MAMALVDGRVRRQEVKIVAALRIPNGGSLSTSEDNREGVVVVGCELLLRLNGLLGGGSMVRTGSVGRHAGGKKRRGELEIVLLIEDNMT
jgi:hypothetical protein